LELLRREKAALGCYVTGHPLYRYGTRLGRIAATPTLKVAAEQAWSVVSVAGMVEGYREKLFRTGGGRVAFFEIEDVVGRVGAKLRGDKIETYAALLTRGDPVVVTGKVSFPVSDDPEEEREPTLLVDSVELVAAAILKSTRLLVIRLDAGTIQREQLAELGGLLRRAPGGCPVELLLDLGDGSEAALTLGSILVTPDDTLLAGLERLFGSHTVELA
jgi:DNA polymerase-3 subunit alpha